MTDSDIELPAVPPLAAAPLPLPTPAEALSVHAAVCRFNEGDLAMARPLLLLFGQLLAEARADKVAVEAQLEEARGLLAASDAALAAARESIRELTAQLGAVRLELHRTKGG